MTNMAVSRRCEWQNKIIRIFFSFFIAIGAVLNIAPFSVVYAEGVTYLSFDVNNPYIFDDTHYLSTTSNDEVRVTILGGGGSNMSYKTLYFFSDSSESYDVSIRAGRGGATIHCTANRTYDNISYYCGSVLGNGINGNVYNIIGQLESNYNNYDGAYPYTFGDLAVGESVPIDYGSIKDLSYSTNIVGSGTTTGDANIDTISWYPYWDTNSNISTTWNMQIQVVPGTWQGGTATDIFSQSYQNFIINESGALDIYRGTYLNGSFSISWGEVKNKLSILSWADLFQYFDGTYWNKKGWVYRARFNDPDSEYWSEWQTVYTVTSSAGEGVENIIDPSTGTGLGDFNNNVENSYNTTSVVNNNYNVTYYYNGIPVDTNVNDEEITDYSEKIYEVTKQIRDILINLNTNNSTTENNDNDETITNNLNSVVDDLHNTENQFMTDMDEKLNDIDRNVQLLNDNKFIAAANWVRVQYDNIVSDTPFELIIVFGLVLSLALIIIGKIR